MATSLPPTTKKVALIMGIANQRSIAWSCMERFLQSREENGWSIIYTVQTEKARSKVEALLETKKKKTVLPNSHSSNSILGGYACDVTAESSMQQFFREALPEVLHHHQQQQQASQQLSLQAVIHSIAFAPHLRIPLLETSRESFLEAQEISAYSLIEVARESLPYLQSPLHQADGIEDDATTPSMRSITTLSYLGAMRAIPGYNVMGPAKASLEGVVRGLAVDLGRNGRNSKCPVRVNAVRAGPLPTISSKGGIAGFDLMRKDVEDKAPLGNVTPSQVADSVYHVAAEAHGMTGQCINIDGGYSIVAGPSLHDVS